MNDTYKDTITFANGVVDTDDVRQEGRRYPQGRYEERE